MPKYKVGDHIYESSTELSPEDIDALASNSDESSQPELKPQVEVKLDYNPPPNPSPGGLPTDYSGMNPIAMQGGVPPFLQHPLDTAKAVGENLLSIPKMAYNAVDLASKPTSMLKAIQGLPEAVKGIPGAITGQITALGEGTPEGVAPALTAALFGGAGKLMGGMARWSAERTALAPTTAANSIAAGLEIKNPTMLANVRTVTPYVNKLAKATGSNIDSVASLSENLNNLKSAIWSHIESIYNGMGDMNIRVGDKVREALGRDITEIGMEQTPSIGKKINKISNPWETRSEVPVKVIVAKIKENNVKLEGLYSKFQKSWDAVKGDSQGGLLLKENETLKNLLQSKAEDVPGASGLRDLNRLYGKTKELAEYISDKADELDVTKSVSAGYRLPNYNRVVAGLKHAVNPLSERMTPFRMVQAGISRMNTPDALIRHAFDVMGRVDTGGPLLEQGVAAQNFIPPEGQP